jgi:hypothetical protein
MGLGVKDKIPRGFNSLLNQQHFTGQVVWDILVPPLQSNNFLHVATSTAK